MTWILAIGGTDSSGGAGLTRDTAMAASMGYAVKPAVTAVTVQTDAGLEFVHPVPPETVAAQIRAACAGGPPGAVKVGMAGTKACAEAVAEALPRGVPVVLDPVLKTSSGGTLMETEALAPLIARAALVTPNLGESAALSGLPPGETVAALADQARALLCAGAQAVLIKGGHGTTSRSTDCLFTRGTLLELPAPRLPKGKRGSGCSLATAIACELARGASLSGACRAGKAATRAWLAE